MLLSGYEQYGEERDFHEMSGSKMDSLLARFV